MREIIFRGQDSRSKKWIYGYYNGRENSFARIIDTYNITRLVNPETVGQYTGLTDKNGTKIFEGDVVHWKKVPYFVRWDSKKAEFVFANDMEADYFVVGFNEHTTMKFCKVVGNIHDNPELLQD